MTKIAKLANFIFLFLYIGISCNSNNNSSTDYLQKVLGNLEKIKSASYSSLHKCWLPGDTAAYGVYCRLTKEFDNPADTTIGASFIWFDCDMPAVFRAAYDGTIKAVTYKDKKIIVIDNFTTRFLQYRPVSPPFFNRTKNIIQYALTTKDSVILDLKELDKDYYFRLVINEDKQVEFFGKAYYMPENPYTLYPTSIYELWINKSNNLPYKVRREMSNQTTIETISNVELNKLSLADFNVYDYFPVDYEIHKYGEENGKSKEADLTSKKTPFWTLADKDGQNISLFDFKGKVLLLQLTGIGCGPCQASIPFLKEIKEKYSDDSFELIAIETWKRTPHSLQYYSKKNELNYNLLCGTDAIIKEYQTGGAVPVFFILDKEQIIRKIIHGYSEERTRKEIIETINKLLWNEK